MTSFAEDIAIVGAGGITGIALIDNLRVRGCRPRAMLRDRRKAAWFDGKATVVTGDLADRGSLVAAFSDMAVVHFIPPVFCDREEEYAGNLIAAAMEAGVGRITYHSVLHAPTPGMPHHCRKSLVELLLRESSLDWTILQPAMYMQTPLVFFDREQSVLAPPFDPARRFNPIDLSDVAEATANILLQPGHEFATYELAGVERLDFHRMAEIIAQLSGRPVDVVEGDRQLQVDAAASIRGFDDRQVGELLAMCCHYDAHGLVGNGNVLGMLLGRAPRNFAFAVARLLAMPV